ncbi:unnamed protein product [Trichobilharzia regenti]|nr:unnamed protein product [Trichobilharzia regenti]
MQLLISVLARMRELDVIGRSELDHQKLALEIGKDWRRLAPVLGFSEQDIKMIDRISPDLHSATNEFDIENQRAENLLALWKHRAAASGLTDKDALGESLRVMLSKEVLQLHTYFMIIYLV